MVVTCALFGCGDDAGVEDTASEGVGGASASGAGTEAKASSGASPNGSGGDAATGGGSSDGGGGGGGGGVAPDATLASFDVQNTSAHDRSEWVKVALPFARGALPSLDGARALVEGTVSEVLPLRWYYDPETGERDSVAVAQLRTRVTLAAGERRTYVPAWADDALAPHAPGAAVASWLADAPDGDAFVLVYLPGDPTPLRAPLVAPDAVDIDASQTSVTRRYRSHFTRSGGAHALSLTTYFTFDTNEDHGEIVVVTGNDTLEQPVGGIDVERVEIHARTPFHFRVRDPGAFAIPAPQVQGDEEVVTLLENATLGDGMTYAVRGRFAIADDLSGEMGESFAASVEARLFGLASFASWDASGATGPWGVLPAPRFASVEEGREALAAGCTEVIEAAPFAELGYINRAPGSTGDQPDFGSNIPVFHLQALQTGSPCPLRKAAIAADREALRPSHYHRAEGANEVRVTAEMYPDLFFWGGRPHFSADWNAQYPEWTTRAAPFDGGATNGWLGMDDQHYGNNTLRAIHEITGDAYTKELAVYHQSLIVWNYLTDWIGNASAERAVGRTLKEAVLTYMVEDSTPTAALLREGTIAKNALLLELAEEFVEQHGVVTLAPVRDDGRVELTTEFPGQDVAMAWQTGFHMEYQALALRNGWGVETARAMSTHYMDAVDAYFAEDGQPVTYFLLSDPSQRDFGGIGVSWWTGWIAIARERQDHPSHPFFADVFTPFMATAMEPAAGTLWSPDDRWRNFE